MIKFEKYKMEIRNIYEDGEVLAVVNGIPVPCKGLDCNGCDLKPDDCEEVGVMRWGMEEVDDEPTTEVTLSTLAKSKIAAARQQGQEEAWALAEELFRLENDELYEIFDEDWNILGILSAPYSVVAQSVKAWKESKVVKVGDVVREAKNPEYDMAVVEVAKFVESNYSNIKCVYGNFVTSWYRAEDLTKTGRTLPVQDWLKQIGGKEE